MQKISDALMGCVEIPLFLKFGIGRFEGDRKSALFSFAVPILLLPVAAFLARGNPDFSNQAFQVILIKFTLDFVFSSIIYLMIMQGIAKQFEREKHFFGFVNAYNWLNLTQMILLAPFLAGVLGGQWEWEKVYYFLIFLIFYGYAYQAFLITHMFRINWMLSVSLAILGMAIGEFVHYFIY